MRYVEKLRPVAFLMENVQGMLWTRDAKRDLAVVDVIEAGTRPVAADFLSIESKRDATTLPACPYVVPARLS